jgi:hypothetical protein
MHFGLLKYLADLSNFENKENGLKNLENTSASAKRRVLEMSKQRLVEYVHI